MATSLLLNTKRGKPILESLRLLSDMRLTLTLLLWKRNKLLDGRSLLVVECSMEMHLPGKTVSRKITFKVWAPSRYAFRCVPAYAIFSAQFRDLGIINGHAALLLGLGHCLKFLILFTDGWSL